MGRWAWGLDPVIAMLGLGIGPAVATLEKSRLQRADDSGLLWGLEICGVWGFGANPSTLAGSQCDRRLERREAVYLGQTLI